MTARVGGLRRLQWWLRGGSDREAWAYAAAVWAVLLLLGVVGHAFAPLSSTDTTALLALVLLGLLARTLPDSPVTPSRDGVRFSFFGIVTLAAAVMAGPLGGALVGVIPSLLRPVRMEPVKRVFNAGMFGVVGLVGGLTYLAAGGADPLTVSGASAVLLTIGVPIVVADVAQAVTNAAVLSGMVAVTAGVPFWVYLRGLLASSGAAYVGYGAVAFLLVVLWGPAHIHWFSAVLIVVPLLVAWWVFTQFGAELEAYERTTETLVAALDVRHPGAAAHAQRVAILCDWIGESLMLSPKARGEIRIAGLLHDIGLLGARESDPCEIHHHPTMGARMLDGISFATESLPAIAAHHERLDGSGYPRGLAGEKIPLGARVLAVADAFDALTMGTPEYPSISPRAALKRLAADPGLDPEVVAALARAAERHDILEVSGKDWLGQARLGQRAQPHAQASSRPTQADMAAQLAEQPHRYAWITRHDHPSDRLGR